MELSTLLMWFSAVIDDVALTPNIRTHFQNISGCFHLGSPNDL